jgi:hypothetical protein
MTSFLVSYRPLATTTRGRRAAMSWNLPPFVDGSCRREPDLQSPYPSITALCRAHHFAPKLRVGDEVLYITVKSSFGSSVPAHHKLVAHLRVVHCSKSHQEAQAWYQAQSVPVPNNCMFTGSTPVPYEQTNGRSGKEWNSHSESVRLRWWDGGYRKRAASIGAFAHCHAALTELWNPPRLLEEDFMQVFGRVPGTQNPPEISSIERDALVQAAVQRGI